MIDVIATLSYLTCKMVMLRQSQFAHNRQVLDDFAQS